MRINTLAYPTKITGLALSLAVLQFAITHQSNDSLAPTFEMLLATQSAPQQISFVMQQETAPKQEGKGKANAKGNSNTRRGPMPRKKPNSERNTDPKSTSDAKAKEPDGSREKPSSKGNPIAIGGFYSDIAKLKFNSASDQLLVQERYGDLFLVDVAARRVLSKFESDKGAAIQFNFDKEGKRLVSVKPYWSGRAQGNEVVVWSLPGLKQTQKIPDWWGTWPLAAAFASSSDQLLLLSNKLSAEEHPRVLIQSLSKPQSRTEYLVSKESLPQIVEAVFSADGKYLATISCDDREDDTPGKLCIWDMQSFKLMHAVSNIRKPIWDLQFSGDGKRVGLAIGNVVDNQPLIRNVRIWDVESGQPVKMELPKNLKYPWTLSYLGDRIATAVAESYNIQIFDLTRQAVEKTLRGDGPVAALAFSPNDKFLAIGGDSTLTATNALAFKGDPIFIWKLDEAGEGPPRRFREDDRHIGPPWQQFGPLTVATTGNVRPLSDEGVISDVRYGVNGRLATLSREPYMLKLWDERTGKIEGSVKESLTGIQLANVDDVGFTPDGKKLVMVTKFTSISPGTKKNAENVLALSERNTTNGNLEGKPFPLPSNALDATLSRDCRWLAFSQGYKSTIEIWNVAERKKVHEVPAKEVLHSVSTDGETVAVFNDKVAGWRSARDGWQLKTVSPNKSGLKVVLGLATTPDLSRALILFDGVEERIRKGSSLPKNKEPPMVTLMLWNTRSGTSLQSWEINAKFDTNCRLALNADATRAVFSEETITLFDTSKAKPLGQITLPLGKAGSIQFQPDGKQLAISTWDHIIWIWDPEK